MLRSMLAIALGATALGASAQVPPRGNPPPPPPGAAAAPALDRQEIRAQLSPRRFTTLAAEVSASRPARC